MQKKYFTIIITLMALVTGLKATAATKEAYAVYTESDQALRFYYDEKKSTRTGTVFKLNTGMNDPEWYTDACHNNIQTVEFQYSFRSARPTSTYKWFCSMSKLKNIKNLYYLDTSLVNNMGYMFYGCKLLTSIDLSNFFTYNVKKMCSMFESCEELESIDLSSFDTSKVEDFNSMFRLCKKLTGIDLSHFNTSKVQTMVSMFEGCSNLKQVDMSHFDTYNVTKMYDMFRQCISLKSLDLSSFNTSNVTNMMGMFAYCQSLTSLDLSSFDTKKVEYMRDMFNNCSELTTIFVGPNWSVESVISHIDMFAYCTALAGYRGTIYNSSHVTKEYAHIDLGYDDPGYFSKKDPYAIYADNCLTFYYDTNWPKLSDRTMVFFLEADGEEIVDWTGDTEFEVPGSNGGLVYLPYRTSDVRQVAFSESFKEYKPTAINDWFYDLTNVQSITDIENLNTENVTDMSCLFKDCAKLKSLDLRGLNTSKVTTMKEMFAGCHELESLNLSGLNTSSVTDMDGMFFECNKLLRLDLTSFDTRYVINMDNMFSDCTAITDIDLSSFDTKSVTNMRYMFYNCSSLINLDLSSFCTDNVTRMNSMFSYCNSLTNIDMNGFFTENVTNMSYMFKECSSLTNLDLTCFNTAKVTNMEEMFKNCSNLEDIYVSDEWITTAVTTSTGMFTNCTKLKGGQGTRYSSNYVDKRYARIDRGTGIPGYLTEFMVPIDAQHFPDAAFRQELAYLRLADDGKLTLDEIKEYSGTLELNYTGGIKDLTGIEYFKFTEEVIVNGNQLTTIDMSRNKKLATFSCMDNELTSLKLPNSKTLKYVYCEINKIRGEAMDELIASLPKYSSSEGYGKLYIYNNSDDKYPEGNQLTPDQEQAALAKGWRSWEYDNSQHNYYTSDGYVLLDEINFPDPLFLDYLNENFYNDDFGPRLHVDQLESDIYQIDLYDTEEMSSLKGVEYFKALENLEVSGNRIKTLDLSANKELKWMNLAANYELESLIVANDGKLKYARIDGNKLKGKAMDDFIASLPVRIGGGTLDAIDRYIYDDTEQNVMTESQVAAANEKGWKVREYTRNSWVEYSGSSEGEVVTDLSPIVDNEQRSFNQKAPLYNLQGQRVNHPVKGQLYIQNGRKVVYKR